MPNFFDFDMGEWEEFIQRFEPSTVKQHSDNFLKKEVKSLGEFVRSGSAEKTPVGSYSPSVSFTTRKGRNVSFNALSKTGGNLRRSWSTSSPKKESDGYSINVFNNASTFNEGSHPLAKNHGIYYYAEDVEFGHIATTLDRIPEQTAAGIVRPVKRTPVEGQYMLTDTLQEIDSHYRPVMQEHYRAMLSSLLEGD